jgi:hypothetical protein
MNDQITSQPLTVTLSREELLAVLEVLQATFIPGLDEDPLGEMTPQGRELAVTVARRALEARELGQVGEDGQFLVHRAVLTAVGACAYSQSAVIAFHWPSGSEEATRFFGHLREGDVVIHTRPTDVLHRFALLPSRDALIGQLLDFCEAGEAGDEPAAEFKVRRDDFGRARDAATAGAPAEAAGILCETGADQAAAESLAATLAASPRVSVVQTLKGAGGQEIATREFTLIQNGGHAWWLLPQGGGAAAGDTLTVQTTNRSKISTAVAGWL